MPKSKEKPGGILHSTAPCVNRQQSPGSLSGLITRQKWLRSDSTMAKISGQVQRTVPTRDTALEQPIVSKMAEYPGRDVGDRTNMIRKSMRMHIFPNTCLSDHPRPYPRTCAHCPRPTRDGMLAASQDLSQSLLTTPDSKGDTAMTTQITRTFPIYSRNRGLCLETADYSKIWFSPTPPPKKKLLQQNIVSQIITIPHQYR